MQKEMGEVLKVEMSKEVAEHLVAKKLVIMEKRREISEEEMNDSSEEEKMEEHLMEVSRVKQAVWRPWETERVVEASDLVVEKV